MEESINHLTKGGVKRLIYKVVPFAVFLVTYTKKKHF